MARSAARPLGAAAALILLTACATGPNQAPAASPVSASAVPAASGLGSASAGPGVRPAAGSTWLNGPVTLADGSMTSIAELNSRPVFVEFFATWCVNCRAQLAKTNAAAQQAGSSATFIALSVETDLTSTDMAAYQAAQHFDAIKFAVLSPAMLADAVATLGNTVANPPTTPHLVVAAGGGVGALITGPEEATAILASLSAHS